MFRLDEARDTWPAHIKTLKSGQEIRKPTKASTMNKILFENYNWLLLPLYFFFRTIDLCYQLKGRTLN